jgi:hypothetical protein
MGNWYTNVSLKDVNPADVLAELNDLGRVAVVTPAANRWLVVFDQGCENFDLDTLESLALTLSTRLHCTALATFNADDDVLWFAIYENGQRSSRYASLLHEFEDRQEFPSRREFSVALSRIFDQPDRAPEARSILSRGRGLLGLLSLLLKIPFAYVVEVQRHADLAKLLGLPLGSVGLGYKYVSRGELPDGLDPSSLLRTSGGAFN